MTTALNTLVAAEHVADLRRLAQRRRAISGNSEPADAATIELRLADVSDDQVVRRLAALDDAPELEGKVLLALIDGEGVAALSVRDRRVVANPFVPTLAAVALLRLRSEQMCG